MSGSPDCLIGSVSSRQYVSAEDQPKWIEDSPYRQQIIRKSSIMDRNSVYSHIHIGMPYRPCVQPWHIPHGNTPTVIQHHNLAVIMADTSFSHMKSNKCFQNDNRGAALDAFSGAPHLAQIQC